MAEGCAGKGIVSTPLRAVLRAVVAVADWVLWKGPAGAGKGTSPVVFAAFVDEEEDEDTTATAAVIVVIVALIVVAFAVVCC